jgi:quaternary ammonium compound-resistance protein SugE
MAWIYLLLAGLMECGWPVGLKYAWKEDGLHVWPAVGAIASIILSGAFLLLAQREIPMGTAYAVWTGIGSVGAFALGIILFKEPTEIMRFVCVGLIVLGIVGLKLTSH